MEKARDPGSLTAATERLTAAEEHLTAAGLFPSMEYIYNWFA